MLKNYLLVAWRNLLRNPMLSLINLVGLSISVAFSALLFFHIHYEQSFDRFHRNGDRLYRLEMSDFGDPSNNVHGLEFPLVVGIDLKNRFPEVSDFVRFKDMSSHMGEQLVRAGGQVYKERGVYYTDTTFFTHLSFSLLKGDPRTVLGMPGNVVLSASTAKKYFGSQDPIGKTIELVSDSNRLFRVAGVVQDAPHNSSIQYSMVVPLTADPRYAIDMAERFNHMDYLTVVELKPGADKAALEQKVNTWMRTYFLPDIAQGWQLKPEVQKAFRWYLRPLADGHFNASSPWGHFTDLQAIYQLACIVVVILLLASLNYVLITVSNAAARSQEIGVRKVMGAGRGSVILQFWVETQVIVLIATSGRNGAGGGGGALPEIGHRLGCGLCGYLLAGGIGCGAGALHSARAAGGLLSGVAGLKAETGVGPQKLFGISHPPAVLARPGSRAVRCCMVLMISAFGDQPADGVYQPQRPWLR